MSELEPPAGSGGIYTAFQISNASMEDDEGMRMLIHNANHKDAEGGRMPLNFYIDLLNRATYRGAYTRDAQNIRNLEKAVESWRLPAQWWEELVAMDTLMLSLGYSAMKTGARTGSVTCIMYCIPHPYRVTRVAPGWRGMSTGVPAQEAREAAKAYLAAQDEKVRVQVGNLILGWGGSLEDLIDAVQESLTLGRPGAPALRAAVPSGPSGEILGLGA